MTLDKISSVNVTIVIITQMKPALTRASGFRMLCQNGKQLNRFKMAGKLTQKLKRDKLTQEHKIPPHDGVIKM